MCSTDVYCSKQTGSSSTKGNHHPSFLRFWNWAEETVDAAKICGGAENVKTETQQTFVNGLLGFSHFLGIYTPLEARIVTILYELPIDMGNSICTAHCILRVPSSCFCIVISLFWGWNNLLAQSQSQSGEVAHPRRRRWLHALTDRLLWCATDASSSPAATSSRRASFSASTPILLRILHRAQQHHADASACQQLPRSPACWALWHFCRAGLCR